MWLQGLIAFLFGMALFINTILLIPQLYRLVSSKTPQGLSFITLCGFSLLQLIAICYSLTRHDFLISFGYSLSFILFSGLIIKYKNNRQKNETEIHTALKNFESLVSSMPGHVYWKNKHGVYLGCNEAQANYVKSMYNQDFIGKTLYEVLPHSIADKINADDNYVMNTGKELTIEEILPDGKTVLSKKIPLKDEAKNIIGMLGISFDITERKKQELNVEYSKNQAQLTLENIVANLPAHIFWLDKDGVVLGCNILQARAAGVTSPNELIGKTMFDIYPKGEAQKLQAANLKVMESGQSLTIEEPSAYLNGKKSVFLSKKIPLKSDNGEVIGLLGIAFDITSEKEAEQLRIEKLAVEESLKAAQLMAASIAHEMRTPLGTISAVAGNMGIFMPTVLQGYEIAKAEDKIEEPLSRKSLEYFKESPELLMEVVSGANTFINMMLMKFNPDNIKAQNLVKLSMAASVKSALTIYPMND
ncbi:MAG: Histidine kinase, partial [Gammaproteobacteria bacterium]|nr:Histidine kinase [Gammaproteobacteria bacterium]